MELICNTDSLNQRGRAVLTVDGRKVVLFIKLRWHKKIATWLMSVFNESNTPVLRNIPLVSSASYPSADLLRQFQHLGIGSAAVLPLVDAPATDNPGSDNLGPDKTWALVWGLPDE